MKNLFIEYLPGNPIIIAAVTIIANIIIAISGVLPSAFLTTINIIYFDIKLAIIISIIGESLGAIVSFILYRKGLNRFTTKSKKKSHFLKKLQSTTEFKAVILIILLRILPFIPSGAVTLTAALSSIRIIPFTIASTIGKIPSLLIEVYSINKVFSINSSGWKETIIYTSLILLLLYILKYFRNKRKLKQ
ncbi:VTT domain-containing protein [Niallia sp. MER 6]|uniref:VTT domain-containing protein n=1 Tax=Niallia sp. MER 6 TaxID=2939567 RepID=UPI0020421222|nr:VTT domain-containing protein [Niallia sp. MER 6]MCM3033341.1 VTT domain-containing protein [Niallia sp. MER 6]